MKYLFNPYMLLGAVLGWVIVSSALDLVHTARHKGPGVVHYEDWSEKVPESEYKRHKYVMSGMVLGIGLSLWFFVARTARDEAAKARKKIGNPILNE